MCDREVDLQVGDGVEDVPELEGDALKVGHTLEGGVYDVLDALQLVAGDREDDLQVGLCVDDAVDFVH